MHEFATRVEKRWRFSKKELQRLLITCVIASFSLTLVKGWGFFDLVEGKTALNYVANFIIVLLVLFFSLLIHFSMQKLMALKLGYSSEYKYWINGLILGVIVCFFSYGYIPLFFPGTLFYDIIPKLRVGVFRGGVKHTDLGLIAFAGPLSNIVIVGLIAPLFLATKNSFVYAVIVANLLIAVWSLLPIPTFEKLRQFKGGTTGLYIFIASRWTFVLVFVTVISFAALILLFKVFSYILALIIGILITIIYYSRFEK
ncbi:MAG TPA: hypothetical protein VJ461_00710 [Candidatus Nanoarchaeia archaeon]|nr:hypothetical protein [Candidatus Nanoarchaeia archaeon]